MIKIDVTVKGVMSVLQSRHPTPKEQAFITKRLNNVKAKDITDEQQFAIHAYRTREGLFQMPSEMFEASMAAAAVNYKLPVKGMGKKTCKDLIKGGIIINPIELVFKNQKVNEKVTQDDIRNGTTAMAGFSIVNSKEEFIDKETEGVVIDDVDVWHQDARWGRNANTRGAVWVVRPRIDNWELDFEITLLQDERISTDLLKEILEYAGAYVGVGAWRPKFGRFVITKWNVKK